MLLSPFLFTIAAAYHRPSCDNDCSPSQAATAVASTRSSWSRSRHNSGASPPCWPPACSASEVPSFRPHLRPFRCRKTLRNPVRIRLLCRPRRASLSHPVNCPETREIPNPEEMTDADQRGQGDRGPRPDERRGLEGEV